MKMIVAVLLGISGVRNTLFLCHELCSAKTTGYRSAIFYTSEKIGMVDDLKQGI